jgi:hypothetical protein
MPLSALPLEVCLNICEHLDVFSTFDFARTYKNYCSLFRSIVSDEQYTLAFYKDCEWYEPRVLWEEAESILSDPKPYYVSYVRDFNLLAGRCFCHDRTDSRAEIRPDSIRPSSDNCKRFIGAIRENRRLYESLQMEFAYP